MKNLLLSIALLSACGALNAANWSYRGSLHDAGEPANGKYDLRLTLLDESGKNTVSLPITLHDVIVSQGQFSVDLDFGIDLGNAPALRLKTEVAQGDAQFFALGEPSRFDAKAALAGVCWDTEGNAGTNPTTNFIGTTDNQALVFRSNGEQSLVLQPGNIHTPSGGSPRPLTVNVTAGSGDNLIATGVSGATISGGGTLTDPGNPFTTFIGLTARGHSVTSDFSTIGGGYSNFAGGANSFIARFATVSGGAANNASGGSATISGGIVNRAEGNSSAVPGGSNNCAGGSNSFAAGTRAKIRTSTTGTAACAPSSGDNNGDEGSFVWSDAQAADFISNGPNRFLVRATDGATIQRRIGTETSARAPRGYFNVVQGDSGVTPNLTPSANVVGSFESDGDAFLVLTAPAGSSRGLVFRSPISNNEAGFVYASSASGLQFLAGNSVRMTLAGTGQLTLNTLGSAGSTALCRNASNQISTCSSSERYKSDITPLTLGLDAVAQLRPVSYLWKEDGMADVGFVAEEVAALDERLITRNEAGAIEGVKYDRLSAVLANAVQELAARDTLQATEIIALKTQLNQQQSQSDALQSSNRTVEAKLLKLNQRLAAIEAHLAKLQ